MRKPALSVIAAALWLGAAAGSGIAADYLQSAQSALRKGDLRTAQIELRNAVRSDPQNAEARFLLAEVQLQLGDPVAAEQQARAAEERGYDRNKTTPLIGQAMLMQNRPADLLKQFQPTGKDPKLDAEIVVDRGAAQLALGDMEAARKSFEDAQKLDPMYIQAWLAGARLALSRRDTAAAQTQIDHALAIDSKSLEARLIKAQLLLEAKDVSGAMNLLNQAVNDRPPALPARLLRANILISQGKFSDAKADDDAVLAMQPQNVEGLYVKAILLHEAKDDQGANDILTRLQPIFDRIPRAYYLQALVRQKLGQTELAAASARDYVARVPNDPNGVKLLAQLEMTLGRPDQALAPLQQLFATNRADPQALEMLARVALATGQTQLARDALQKAVDADPNQPALKAQLGGVLVEMGQPDAAVKLLDSAFAQDPKQARFAEALFLAALKTGNLELTSGELDKICKAEGDLPMVQNLDGLLKMARLDMPGAKAEFESILKSNPDYLPAQVNLARVLASEGDNASYQKVLSTILAKDPTSEPALGMLVATLTRDNRRDDAVGLLEKAHAADPKNVPLILSLGDAYIRLGDAQKALDLIAPSSAGGTIPIQYLGLEASAQLALKQTNQARATLTQILDQQPRNIVAVRGLVTLLVDAKDYEGARNVLKTAMAASPEAYQLRLDYALVDLKAKGLDAALATAQDLYNQDRGNPDARALRGDIYMAAGQPEEAAKAYQAAAADAPSWLLTLRLAGAQQRAGKPGDAAKTLAAWVSSHPNDLAAIEALASQEIGLGQYAAAKLHLQAALALAPHNPAMLNNLAWVDQKLGAADAQQIAEQAYLLAPGPQTADTLGWILTSDGNAGKGSALLRQAVAGSNDPRILYHLAVALKDTGDRQGSMKLLQNVASVPGDFEEKTDAQHLLSEMTKGP